MTIRELEAQRLISDLFPGHRLAIIYTDIGRLAPDAVCSPLMHLFVALDGVEAMSSSVLVNDRRDPGYIAHRKLNAHNKLSVGVTH